MGTPTPAILAEIFIHNLKHSHICDIIKSTKSSITLDTRYVYDTTILYNMDVTNIENTLTDFNSMHLNIQFTIQKETENKLNYLGLTITNLHSTLTRNIFRKPTAIYLITHNNSCHPLVHKKPAIKYVINRMNI
jgi:hypothetical protein